jgi:hypothetical protein
MPAAAVSGTISTAALPSGRLLVWVASRCNRHSEGMNRCKGKGRGRIDERVQDGPRYVGNLIVREIPLLYAAFFEP